MAGRNGLRRARRRPGRSGVALDPVAQVSQRRRRALPELGQRILDAGGNLGIDRARDEAVRFEPLERLREHLRADALETTSELAVAQRAVFECADRQRAPLVREQIEHVSAGAHSRIDVVAFALTALTAWETLFDHFGLTADSQGSLLIVGATGGVGSIMVQLAEALLPHVEVIATASDADRAMWVRELGAEHVVNHHQNLIEQVTAIVPEGADWLFTAHSHGQIDTYAQIVRPFGHVVAVDDGPRDVSPLKSRSIAWHWEFMFTRAMHRTPDMIQQHRILEQVADLVDSGLITTTAAVRLSPISASTLCEAHEIVETGHVMGKVVVSGWGDEANG
ncbi:zinc-binding dehydrogenase [Pseudoclavibacter sp. CFCC 13796]|nr:zinc-binding dehydrogenase [Pseudoclavibacter sp. CFCC 13796]